MASNIDELDEEPAGGIPLIANYGGVSLNKQSHGESFMALVENRFGGNGLYILDEPEAQVIEITNDSIRNVNYKETEHFMITKRFMDAPEKMVEEVMG